MFPEDYSTIQEGINASVEGDTVLVAQGNYVENLILEKGNRACKLCILMNLDQNGLIMFINQYKNYRRLTS